MKVLLEFKDSHHYWKEYKKGKLFCPNCGKHDVWEDQGFGDYYEGSYKVCIDCGFMFTMPGGEVRDDEWGQIARQIKSGKADKPTTPLGH